MDSNKGHNTPWTCDLEDWSWDDSGIRDSSGKIVIGVDHEYFTADLSALSFALRAINSHDALLAALKDAVFLTGFEVSGPTDPRVAEHGEPAWVCRARAAIAQAEGGK